MGYAGKFIRSLSRLGWSETIRRVRYVLNRSSSLGNRRAYKRFVKNMLPDEAELQRQRESAQADIRFSILVPLYNTDPAHLAAMLDSVLAQTHANWQLCLADGSEGDAVRDICAAYQKSEIGEARETGEAHETGEACEVCYRRLEHNGGISANTNAALAMADGDYICLLDHDDLLHPSALYELAAAIRKEGADFLYTDEALFDKSIRRPTALHLKPDFAPDTLRSYNYICHLSCIERGLMQSVGGFNSDCDGAQDFDMFLRLTERATRICHLPKVLYFWREHGGSTSADIAAKPYALAAGHRAVAGQLLRLGLKGEVADTRIPSCYRVRYAIEGEPLVSVIIPNRDSPDMLRPCVESVLASTYKNIEVIIAENGSTQPETLNYYREIGNNSRVRVIEWNHGFNFSAINNAAAAQAQGEYLLLLNNDTRVITPGWIEELLMFAQREDVGAAGALLLYPDDSVQHGGVILGIGGVAGHAHKGYHKDDYGYMSRLCIAQNLSAVTGACMMLRRSLYESLGGLDEGYAVAFNDVDLCMRLREAGKLIVFTPFAQLHHHESKSRGYDDVASEKRQRFLQEAERFRQRWQRELQEGDPYYNPGLTLELEDFSLR